MRFSRPTFRTRIGAVVAIVLLATASFGVGDASSADSAGSPTPSGEGTMSAAHDPPASSGVVIVRGEQGVPHITAPNYEKLAYGVAWTLAEDDLCQVAINRLKVRGELARTFGPERIPEAFDTRYETENNVASDFNYRLLQERGFPQRGLGGAQAPSKRARESVRGFVRGYNDFLKRHPDSDPRCAGEPWVKPLTEREVWLFPHRYDDWEFDFTQRLNAEPPGQSGSQVAARSTATSAPPESSDPVDDPVFEHSQAIALGDRVTGGGAIAAYDPHADEFFLDGFARLTIPGRLDVFGHRTSFSPAIYAGANANFSWGVMATPRQRRVVRRLTLAPDSPTSYVVDGETIPMGRDRVSVMVKQPDGTLSKHSHTFYTTKWGDVLVRGDGSRATDLAWTQQTAYATDESAVALASQDLFDYHLDINRAQSFADLRELTARTGGFLDTQLVGADTSGQAFYFGPVGAPNIDAQRQERCINDSRAQAIFAATGEPVLDGSTSDCALPDQPGAFRPGTVGVNGIPQLQDRLYTANANNSHWLVTRSQRLEGFNPFFTSASRRERASIGARPRLIFSIAEELVQQAKTSGRPIDATEVAKAFLDPRDGRTGPELAGVIAWCRDQDTETASDGASIDVAEACDVLAHWDRRQRYDSRGGTLWRLFWAKLTRRFNDSTLPVSTPFSVDDPLNTPRGLRFTPQVTAAFADTVQAIQQAGLPLDVPVGDTLRFVRHGTDGPELPGRGCDFGLLGCNVTNGGVDLSQLFAQSNGDGSNAAFVAQLRPRGPATVEYYSPLQVRNPSSPWFDSNLTDYFSQMRTSTLQIQQPG